MGRSARIAVGAIAAAMAANHIGSQYLAAAIALLVAALLLLGEIGAARRSRPAWPVVMGAGLIAVRLALTPTVPQALSDPPAGDGPWELVVQATGSPREGHQSVTLATLPGSPGAFVVAATLPRYPEVLAGDRVTVEGRIRPRPESAYGDYLARVGAVGTLTSASLHVGPPPTDLGRRLETLRRSAAEALARVLPEPEAGLAAGILIGLRDRVDRDLAAAFTTAGVSHVVAISGWNIAIVAAAVAALAGRLGRRRRSVITMLAIVAYVCFSGASASVVRAALMAGVVLLARETGRAGRAAAALGWAAVLLLVVDPALIDDAGFQLSSLATAGLIAWATPLTDWIESTGRGRAPRWLAESLGVSLAAQAATLPVVLVSFGRLAILAPAVNLAVVPLVAPAMAVGLVAMAGGAIVLAGGPMVVGAVLAAPGWVLLRLVDAIVTGAASVPFASLTLTPPLDVIAATASTGGLLGLTWWRLQRRSRSHRPMTPAPTADAAASARRPAPSTGHAAQRAATLALVVAVAVVGGVVAARPATFARVTVLDVGQGDGILVEGSRGGRLLVDGGPDPDRLLVALDGHIPPWDRRIDTLILTHPHEDHVAGLAMLLDRYHIARVFEPGMIGPGPGYAAWVARLSRPGAPVRGGIGAGDRLQVDEIALRVLWPIRGEVPSRTAGWRDGNQQRVGRAARTGRVAALPADGRRRTGHRSTPPGRGSAARGPPQGRPPRQQDGDHATVCRCGPAEGGRGLRGSWQSVRPPGKGHPRSARRRRCAGAPNGQGRHGRGRVRFIGDDRQDRRRPGARATDNGDIGIVACSELSLRHPGHRPRPGAGARSAFAGPHRCRRKARPGSPRRVPSRR